MRHQCSLIGFFFTLKSTSNFLRFLVSLFSFSSVSFNLYLKNNILKLYFVNLYLLVHKMNAFCVQHNQLARKLENSAVLAYSVASNQNLFCFKVFYPPKNLGIDEVNLMIKKDFFSHSQYGSSDNNF